MDIRRQAEIDWERREALQRELDEQQQELERQHIIDLRDKERLEQEQEIGEEFQTEGVILEEQPTICDSSDSAIEQRENYDADVKDWEEFTQKLMSDDVSAEEQQAPLVPIKDVIAQKEQIDEDEANERAIEKFKMFFPANENKIRKFLKENESDDDSENETLSEEQEAEKVMADFQVNINRLAAEYYMAHNGDMTGFSLFTDNVFAQVGMQEPELREHFVQHATFSKIETADDDMNFSTYAMPETDVKEAIRNAMLTFYHANPQYGVSDADIQSVDIGSFRNGIVYAPDGRAFSVEQVSPEPKAKPAPRMSM